MRRCNGGGGEEELQQEGAPPRPPILVPRAACAGRRANLQTATGGTNSKRRRPMGASRHRRRSQMATDTRGARSECRAGCAPAGTALAALSSRPAPAHACTRGRSVNEPAPPAEPGCTSCVAGRRTRSSPKLNSQSDGVSGKRKQGPNSSSCNNQRCACRSHDNARRPECGTSLPMPLVSQGRRRPATAADAVGCGAPLGASLERYIPRSLLRWTDTDNRNPSPEQQVGITTVSGRPKAGAYACRGPRREPSNPLQHPQPASNPDDSSGREGSAQDSASTREAFLVGNHLRAPNLWAPLPAHAQHCRTMSLLMFPIAQSGSTLR